jgi:hypothetical protein
LSARSTARVPASSSRSSSPSFPPHTTRSQQYDLLYAVRSVASIEDPAWSASGHTQILFLEAIEQSLHPLNERTEYGADRFAVWRLSRLAVLVPDWSVFEDAVLRVFSGPHSAHAAEALPCLNPSLAKRSTVGALTATHEGTLLSGVAAIRGRGFDTNDSLIGACLLRIESPTLLKAIPELPVKSLSQQLSSGCSTSVALKWGIGGCPVIG